MRRLTEGERRTYDEAGYVVVRDVFDTAELAAIDREVDRLLPTSDAGPRKPGWIHGLGARSPVTQRFATDERVIALIDDIVKPGIAVHTSKLVAKPPHFATVCHWHQDEAYYFRPDDPATRSETRMSIWVPLQAADERNGCLWVVPGSHRWGIDPYHVVSSGQCIKVLDREAYAEEHAIPVPVEAGSVVLFSAWLWHHSKGNETEHVRRAFIVSYQEATIGHGGADEWRLVRAASAVA